MKIIIYRVALLVSLAGTAALAWGYQQKFAAQEATIARQEALIKEMAAMETVGITITNNFKTNAVLGKASVNATVENSARQVANILRGELTKEVRRDTTALLRLTTGN
jgi:flagellar basal body-associated protein FliL